jgi:hypothetical protein
MNCDIETGARNLLLNCAGAKPLWDGGRFTCLDSQEARNLLSANGRELFNSSILEDIGI